MLVARFRYCWKGYKRSLRTTNRDHAEAALRRIEDALHWLAIGKLSIPDGIDGGDFLWTASA